MESIRQHLSNGVKKIITRHSPEGTPEGCGEFLSSTHPQREIFYVLKGCSRYMFNGKVYDATPGTFFLIDYWEPHAFGYHQQDHDLIHLWMQVSEPEQLISGNFLKVGMGGEFKAWWDRVKLSLEYKMMLTRRWNALNEEKNITQDMVNEFLKAPLEALLDEVRFFMSRTGQDSVSQENPDTVIESLKRYIRMSNARGCSLEHLEKVSGYSRFYLSHRFRECEDCTIGEYIDKIRIEYTIEAMKRGLRQKEISFELGFSTPSNFWIWLRKHRDVIHSAVSGNSAAKKSKRLNISR